MYRDIKFDYLADKVMYSSGDDKQNYHISRLKLGVEMFGNLT